MRSDFLPWREFVSAVSANGQFAANVFVMCGGGDVGGVKLSSLSDGPEVTYQARAPLSSRCFEREILTLGFGVVGGSGRKVVGRGWRRTRPERRMLEFTCTQERWPSKSQGPGLRVGVFGAKSHSRSYVNCLTLLKGKAFPEYFQPQQ